MTDHLTENARLRAALEFYANPDAWNQPPVRTREGLVSVEYENEASKMQRDRGKIARAALATPAPDAVQEAAIDIAAIESGGKRWHGEDHRVVAVRWEPYKPDGQRQMKAKGRWQEQVGSGDYWRWQNCDRPAALRAIAESEASHDRT